MANLKKRRLGALLGLFFNAFLLTLFIIQALIGSCLLIYGYVPLPSDWGNRLIAQRLNPDILLQVDEFRLRPGGYIDLIRIDVKTAGIQQSLLRAESAEIKLEWAIGIELPRIENLVVSAGTLFIPSVYSPDGHQRPLLERIALRIVPNDPLWEVDRFAALHDNIRLRGAFQIPMRTDSSGELNIGQALSTFYMQAAKLTQQKESIHYFQTPTIVFKTSSINDDTQQIDLHITSPTLQHPEVTAEKVQLNSQVQLKGLDITPITAPRLTAHHIELPRYELAAEGLSTEIATEQLNEALSGKWPKLILAAKRITLKQFTLDAPILEIDANAYPEVAFRGAIRSLDGAIDLDGDFHTQLWSGRLRARGSVDLAEIAPENLRKQLPNLRFASTPEYDLKLQFDPGFSVKEAAIKADVNNLLVENLHVDHMNAHASYKDGRFTVEDLYLRRQQQWLELKFSLDSQSYDYHVSLAGSAVPYEYNALLPRWWEAIFKDFDFSGNAHIFGDFIIYGNARRKVSDLYFGCVEAREVSYKGVSLDQADLVVRGRGRYTELHDLSIKSGLGWARGDIAFVSKPDEVRAPASIRLEMEAKITLGDASKLLPEKIAPILSYFETNGLPQSKLKAAIFNRHYPQYAGKSFLDLYALCVEPIKFKKIPLDQLSLDLYARHNITYLRDVQLGYAGGEGLAAIDILATQGQDAIMRYQFTLENAKQQTALQNLPQFDKLEDGLGALKDGNPKASTNARFDLTLHGEGPIKDTLKHAGYGSFSILNDQLGTIQLLGPLSKVLQNTQLNFTSLNLNRMQGDFRYKNENVHFDPLEIQGALTRIQAPGRLRLSDQSLDMRVSVSLFANAGKPESRLRKIGGIISRPFLNLLEFELSGTLMQQKLRSIYDPRNYIPSF